MGEVEREVRAEVRFEFVDGILEGFFVGQVLTGLLLNQSRLSGPKRLGGRTRAPCRSG